VYIERANQTVSYPQLARVLVFYNGRVGFAPTLAAALDQVLPGASAVVPNVPGQAQTQPPAQAGTPPASPALPPAATNTQAAAAATAIQQAINDLKTAQRNGDFVGQGEALQRLDQAVQQFQQANGQTPTPAPPPPAGG
jgi:uncharacterized membrane protein (UPF0182 family)